MLNKKSKNNLIKAYTYLKQGKSAKADYYVVKAMEEYDPVPQDNNQQEAKEKQKDIVSQQDFVSNNSENKKAVPEFKEELATEILKEAEEASRVFSEEDDMEEEEFEMSDISKIRERALKRAKASVYANYNVVDEEEGDVDIKERTYSELAGDPDVDVDYWINKLSSLYSELEDAEEEAASKRVIAESDVEDDVIIEEEELDLDSYSARISAEEKFEEELDDLGKQIDDALEEAEEDLEEEEIKRIKAEMEEEDGEEEKSKTSAEKEDEEESKKESYKSIGSVINKYR